MSFTVSPQVVKGTAPTASDDTTRGFVVGSVWVDTSTAPDTVYICSSAVPAAATWVAAGGVTSHPALSTLGWSASGHTGTTNSVACFDSATGAAQTVQATSEGSVLTYTGGVLTFAVFAMTVAYLSEKGYEINYVSAFTDAASSATVVAGTMV
jgi:hypothetical protein